MRSTVRPWPLSDAQTAERVRARLGVVVRHPRAVHVRVEDGRVVLSGPILADEEPPRLLAAVAAMRGVRAVESPCASIASPELQGAPARPRGTPTFPLMERVWSPTARLVAVTGGGAPALWGLRRGGLAGSGAAAGGLALLLRGATNLELRRLLGIGAGPEARARSWSTRARCASIRPTGGTRIHLRVSWNPPGGAVGDGVAALLRRDPKRAGRRPRPLHVAPGGGPDHCPRPAGDARGPDGLSARRAAGPQRGPAPAAGSSRRMRPRGLSVAT